MSIDKKNPPFHHPPLTAAEAQYEAQKIAFSPYTFQAVRVAWKSGMLACLAESAQKQASGETAESIASHIGVSVYGVTVILESCFSVGVVDCEDERYHLTKVGRMFLHDPMTQINMNYAHDVNYLGLYRLEDAIRQGRPAGLAVLGDWPTIYPGLSILPEPARKSWFDFDHFYSDNAFPTLLSTIFSTPTRKILDIGGNTGKFAIACAQHDAQVQVTIADLPEQLAVAQRQIEHHGFASRLHGIHLDVLEEEIPPDFDVICMSQFLDCFSEAQIIAILKRARQAMDEHTRLFILETCWNNQRFETAAFCIVNTSLYFTAMANGTSRMYKLEDLLRLAGQAHLQVRQTIENIGMGHTLLELTK